MFAVQNLAKVTPRITSVAIQQSRNCRVVSKPRVRVSFAEKIAHGIFMSVAALTIPVSVALNFNKWREGRGE